MGTVPGTVRGAIRIAARKATWKVTSALVFPAIAMATLRAVPAVNRCSIRKVSRAAVGEGIPDGIPSATPAAKWAMTC